MLDIAHIPALPITSQMFADAALAAQREARAANTAWGRTFTRMLAKQATPSEAAEAARRSIAADARLDAMLGDVDGGAN